ncbi:hypothetical protein FQN54_009465 [Arachnomyces sp. PD_36]|nr:hypothetical protein FQN54_009465 [Arachnomyces sp. PD_36]
MKLTLLWAFAATVLVEAALDNPEELTRAAMEKGKERLARLNGQRSDSDAPSCVFNDEDWTFEKGGSDTRQSDATTAEARLRGFIDAVKPSGLTSDDPDWYNIVAISPARDSSGQIPASGDKGSVYYENGFNPVANYISVIDVYNAVGRGATSSTSAAWALWQKVKSERTGSQSYGDLQSVIHYSCINPGAKTVGGDIFYDLEGTEKNVVREYFEGDDEYAALLGIDNGVFATNLLMNYPDSMGRTRKIKSITAWLDEYNQHAFEQVIGVSYTFD